MPRLPSMFRRIPLTMATARSCHLLQHERAIPTTHLSHEPMTHDENARVDVQWIWPDGQVVPGVIAIARPSYGDEGWSCATRTEARGLSRHSSHRGETSTDKCLAPRDQDCYFDRQPAMRPVLMRVCVGVGLAALMAASQPASAQTVLDTIALASAAGSMISVKRDAAGGRIPGESHGIRPGLLGRSADSAFAAALYAWPDNNTSIGRASAQVRLPNLTYRLTSLASRGDTAVVGIESESCDMRVATGMNWWLHEGTFLFVRDSTRRWQFQRPLIGGRSQDGTCRKTPV